MWYLYTVIHYAAALYFQLGYVHIDTVYEYEYESRVRVSVYGSYKLHSYDWAFMVNCIPLNR